MDNMDKSRERKTSEEIKGAIILELNKGPKTVSEIAEGIKSNWITTEKFLNELITEKRVIELISALKSKVYGSLSDPAFFNLPLSNKTREKTLSLLKTIQEVWKKETDSPLQKTVLQKLAVKFVEINNLQNDIPVLRFHYGQTLAMRSEENMEIKLYPLENSQERALKNLIKEYKGYSAKDAKLKQYEKPSMIFYKIKEEAFNNLRQELNKNKFFNLLANYPSELSESFTLFDRFIYCAISVLKLKKGKEDYLIKLKEIFSLVWDCLTTEAYFYDVEKSIAPEKKDLFLQLKSNCINSKVLSVSSALEEIEGEINNLELEEMNTSDNLSDFVHELFSE
jgi:hypothetical protein